LLDILLTEKVAKSFSAKNNFMQKILQSQNFLLKNENKSILVRVCFFAKKAEK